VASYRAIEGVCGAVIDLLRDNYDPDDFNQELEFRVYSVGSFNNEQNAPGVSLFLFRIFVDGVHRIPPGRVGPGGERFLTKLPVDLCFLLTCWGKDPSLQQAIAGWMMRVLEDHPILPAGLLNRRIDGIFHPDETVELTVAELSNEDLLRLWEMIGRVSYQLSVPYIARNVRIESTHSAADAEPVQERISRFEGLAVGEFAGGRRAR
jgi:hypothetical protein